MFNVVKFRIALLKYEIERQWHQRCVWWVLRLIPKELKYWIIIQAATMGERGNPAQVTAITMMEKIKPTPPTS